jgi:hypothetical protein
MGGDATFHRADMREDAQAGRGVISEQPVRRGRRSSAVVPTGEHDRG